MFLLTIIYIVSTFYRDSTAKQYFLMLLGGQDYIEFDNSKIDETDISLITGKLRISNTSNLDHKKDDAIR